MVWAQGESAQPSICRSGDTSAAPPAHESFSGRAIEQHGGNTWQEPPSIAGAASPSEGVPIRFGA